MNTDKLISGNGEVMGLDVYEKAKQKCYKINKYLLIFFSVSLAFVIICKNYIAAFPWVLGIVVLLYNYKFIKQEKIELFYKMIFYTIYFIAAYLTIVMGPSFGFAIILIVMLVPPILAYEDKNEAGSSGFVFSFSFTKREICSCLAVTAAAIIIQQIVDVANLDYWSEKTAFGGYWFVAECNVIFVVNAIISIAFLYNYLKKYKEFIYKNEELLKEKADYDELTALYNRNRVKFILEHAFKDAKANSVPFGVAIMDIDDFKKINDTFGHNAGDYCLREFASVLVGIVKKCEGQIIAGRWGGEEFLLIYYGDNREDFYMLLEYVRMNICDHKFVYEKKKIDVAITIGMTLYNNENSFEEVVDMADKNLYYGKKHGKNQVVG